MRTKIALFLILWFMPLANCCHATPPSSYTEYKVLSSDAQRMLVADEADPKHRLYLSWLWRFRAGDKVWKRREYERLIEGYGHIALFSFFQECASSKTNFLQQDLEQKVKLSPPKNDLTKTAHQMEEQFQLINGQLDSDIELLAALKMSDEAVRLNDTARRIVIDWTKRAFESNGVMLSQQELEKRDDARRQMLDKMNKLPRFSAQETEMQLNALPPDHPNARFTDIPDKR